MLTFAVYLIAFLLLIIVLFLVRISNIGARNADFLYSLQEIVHGLREEVKTRVDTGTPKQDTLSEILDQVKNLAMHIQVDLQAELEIISRHTLDSSLDIGEMKKSVQEIRDSQREAKELLKSIDDSLTGIEMMCESELGPESGSTSTD